MSVGQSAIRRLAPQSLDGCPVPRHHQRALSRDGGDVSREARTYGSAGRFRLRGRLDVLEALAMSLPAARTGTEASATDSARGLAAKHRQRPTRSLSPGVDPQRRLPRHVAVERQSNRVREAPRYGFSNRSDDIKTLFCRSCDALGIRWTRPSHKEVAIYRLASVQLMDEYVGPKTSGNQAAEPSHLAIPVCKVPAWSSTGL